ncbi:MAG: hypothetical protein LC799_31860 [Actinobacteria bacterium]|nr:hypothetical protein [Actinomycetota bacterium]
MSQPDFDTMTDAELAAYQYSHREDPLGDEADLEKVEVEIAHPLSVSMSFRLPPEEASAIRAAAERAGMSMSDWIRGVCTAAAQADAPIDAPVPHQRVNIAKARRLLAELDGELNRAVEQAEHPATTSTSRPGQSRRDE